jgi:hypothetical protein
MLKLYSGRPGYFLEGKGGWFAVWMFESRVTTGLEGRFVVLFGSGNKLVRSCA